MKIKYLFQAIILMRCVFLAVPGTYIKPFPFAKGSMMQVPASTYAWALLELVAFFALALLFYRMVSGSMAVTADRVKSIYCFLIVSGLDLLDFIIRGNSEWFMIGGYPFTSNILILIVYFIFTFNLEEDGV